MNILEQEIEDVVWNSIAHDKHEVLHERGLPIYKGFTYIRQMELSAYGRADMIGFKLYPLKDGKRVCMLHVFEFKKEMVGVSTLLQAMRYSKGFIDKMLAEFPGAKLTVHPFFILVGKNVEQANGFSMGIDMLANVWLGTFKIDLIQGITFAREKGYYHPEELFNEDTWFREKLINNFRDQYGKPPIVDGQECVMPF